jgi:RNA polymerase sigma factor (sigma-70 family)
MPPPKTEQVRWFAEEVQPHESDLRAYLQRQFPKITDVDDMVQDSFVRLLQARETGRIACVRAYLFTIARNAALALLRRPKIFDENPITDSAILRIVESDADVAEQVSTRQEIALLLDAIDALPARCREIFILRKLQGISQKDIARQLGISDQTVQVQVARGARKCAHYLRSRGVIARNFSSRPTEPHNASA